jgi:hypothetical protein
MAKATGVKTMKQITKPVKATPLTPAATSMGATLGKLPNVSAASTVIKRKKPESINAFMSRRNKKGI